MLEAPMGDSCRTHDGHKAAQTKLARVGNVCVFHQPIRLAVTTVFATPCSLLRFGPP